MGKLALGMAAIGALTVLIVGVPGATGGRVRNGGTFRIAFQNEPNSFDPARSTTSEAYATGQLTGLLLLTFPDSSNPSTPFAPDAARSLPRVSRDARTYTFVIRKGLRFNTGAPVTAANFAAAINRNLAMGGPAARYLEEIVGAKSVERGHATAAAGVIAHGDRLVIHLTKPVGDFMTRMELPSLAAIPTNLPQSAEGVDPPIPSAGPYYYASWQRGRQLTIKRNPFYRGLRPHHVDGFRVTFGDDPGTITAKIRRGDLDYGDVSATAYGELRRSYGVNRSRYWVHQTQFSFFLVVNEARPLFANNLSLRRAVSFAIDRSAIVGAGDRAAGDPSFGADWATPTDHYLAPGLQGGFKNARIYPLRRPNFARARRLAFGHLGNRRVVLYTCARDPCLSQAQIVSNDLRSIGLRVQIKSFPKPVLYSKLATPGEPFDLAFGNWGGDYADPGAQLDPILLGSWSFKDAPFRRRLIKVSALVGAARIRAYAKLDVDLARDSVPLVPLAFLNTRELVSSRVGCMRFNPNLDLEAVCLT